jgi:hypothetical protein
MMATWHRNAADFVVAAQNQKVADVVGRFDGLLAHLVRESIRVEYVQRVQNLFRVQRRPQTPFVEVMNLSAVARSADPARQVQLLHQYALVLAELARLGASLVAGEFHDLTKRVRLFVRLLYVAHALSKSARLCWRIIEMILSAYCGSVA